MIWILDSEEVNEVAFARFDDAWESQRLPTQRQNHPKMG